MRQHVESAVILLHYKCGWFFCPPTLPPSLSTIPYTSIIPLVSVAVGKTHQYRGDLCV
jgi:hypothetical protein